MLCYLYYTEADKFILVDRKYLGILRYFPHELHVHVFRLFFLFQNILIFHGLIENWLFQYVTLPELPAVMVFKDGTYFVYDGK